MDDRSFAPVRHSTNGLSPALPYAHTPLLITKQEQTLFKDLRRQDIEIENDETKKE